MPGSLFLVATPIGNLEDITLRALRVLKEVDVIAAEDTRRTARLLSHYGITTPTTSLHEHNERSRVPGLLRQVREGLKLAVVTDAGVPTISDPGYLIVRQALDLGVDVTVVPGVSALTTAVAGAGLPSDSVHFLGFPPSRTGQRRTWLARHLSDLTGTAVLFEAPGRVRPLLNDLAEVVGDRYVVVAHELTKLHESWHRGWARQLVESSPGYLPERGEFVVLVSDQIRQPEVVSADVPASKISAMFETLSDDPALSRREIIARVAAAYSLPKRDVYTIVERLKSSGK